MASRRRAMHAWVSQSSRRRWRCATSASRASPRPCNRVRRVSARPHRRRSTGGPAGSQTPVLENINGSEKEGREEEGHEKDRQEGWCQEEDCPQGGKEAEVRCIAVAVCSRTKRPARCAP